MSLEKLEKKKQALFKHLQHSVVIQAIIYTAGEEGLENVIDALAKMPEEKRAEFGAQYVEFTRQLAKDDLYFLCAHVLDNFKVMGECHKEMCKPSGKTRELDLWPREHMKSTVLTEARSVQYILKNPDIRILITNEILGNAGSFLIKIERYFETCDALRFLFGNWVGPRWNSELMVVRTRKKNLKEPTVSIGALEHVPVSQHYDVIIADDVVGRSNIGTPEQIKKVERFFSDLEDLLDKEHGVLSIVGTRWHENDYYATVMERFSNHPRWRIRVHPIFRENGAILFPERFSQEAIDYLKLTKGPYEFSSQYMLQPVAAEDADFKQEWWQKCLYKRGEYPENLHIVITCDPASSNKEKTSDFTVYTVVGVDERGVWWLVDMVRDHLNPQERVDTLFDLYAKWKLVSPYLRVGIETVGFQETMKFYTNQQMQAKQMYFQVIDLKTKNAHKNDRIRSLVPRFSHGSLRIPDHFSYTPVKGEQLDLTATLKDEYSFFPRAKHDDMMDCLAYVNQIMPSVSGTLNSGVPSSMSSDWVKDVAAGRVHYSLIEDKYGLRKEDIDAKIEERFGRRAG